MKLKRLPFILLVTCFFSSSFLNGDETADNNRPTQYVEIHGRDRSLLCGVKALYLGLRFLGNDKVSYSELLKKFPNARVEGVSLAQLSEYLVEKGYFCKYAGLSKRHIEKMGSGVIAFVIIHQKEGISHLIKMRKKEAGIVQILDAPDILREIKVSDIGEKRLDCLLVSCSEKEISDMTNGIRTWILGGLMISGAGLCVSVFFLRGGKSKSEA
jgi:hypothetical protein